MHTIEKHRNHLIIQIGHTYNYKGRDYKVLTATSEIVSEQADKLLMTESVYWLEDVETKERKYVKRRILEEELPKYNKVVEL